MATSDVDITNMALGHLGDKAGVSSLVPPDGSVQAAHAARVFAHIRDGLLESFPWKFALRRATLALRSGVEVGSWSYVYAEPNQCLRIVNVLPGTYTRDDQGVEYDTETDDTGQGIILTNAEDAVARFIARIENPAVFTPTFTECFTWLLASALAGPIIKGETGRAEAIRCLQAGQLAYASATRLSANQSRIRINKVVPSIIAARGGMAEDDSFSIRNP